jgi:hypothetical protein
MEKYPSELIPTNWLDPLLTGKGTVLGDAPWFCPDIERLLNAIKKRIQEWEVLIDKLSGINGICLQ